jgi:hypothetical protein
MVKKEEKKKLPTIDIKGKPYVVAKEKLLYFHEICPNGAIISDIVEQTPESITILTKCIPDVDKPERYFTGLAMEIKGSTFINGTSHVENCETSSRARALSGLGIGIEETCASADEVANAIIQQDEKKVIREIRDIVREYNNMVIKSEKWLRHSFRLGVCHTNTIDKNLFYILNSETLGKAIERKQNVNFKFTKRMEETMKALEKEKKELQEKFDEFDDKEKAKFNNDFLLYKDYMINKSFHEQGG